MGCRKVRKNLDGTDRGDDRRGLHAAVPPALHVRRVAEQVGHLDSGQAARRELVDLGVERPAHGADLVLREPLYTHLGGDPLHLPRRHAVGHDSATALSERE